MLQNLLQLYKYIYVSSFTTTSNIKYTLYIYVTHTYVFYGGKDSKQSIQIDETHKGNWAVK